MNDLLCNYVYISLHVNFTYTRTKNRYWALGNDIHVEVFTDKMHWSYLHPGLQSINKPERTLYLQGKTKN